MRALWLAVLAALSLAGCGKSEKPIAHAGPGPIAPGGAEPIDARLLGTWRCVTAGDSSAAVLTVAEAPEGRYRAELVEDGHTDSCLAYGVRVGAERVLNVQLLPNDNEWALARYTLYRPNLLLIESGPSDTLMKAATQADGRLLERVLKEREPFGVSLACVRIEKK